MEIQPAEFIGVGSGKKLAKPWSNQDPYPGFDPMADLRIIFDATKTIEPEPSRAKITIYNLSPENRDRPKKDDLITLRAGYVGDAVTEVGPSVLPIVFVGNITLASQKRSGPNQLLEIEAGDGTLAYKKALVNTLVPKGSSITDAISKLKDKFIDLGVEVMSDFDSSILKWLTENYQKASSSPSSEGTGTGGDHILKTGKAIVGKASDLLTKELDRFGLSYSVQNNVLIVRPKGGSDGQPPIIISPQTGLIDSPGRWNRGAAGSKEVQQSGVNFKTLIIAGIEPGRLVDLQTESVEGEYVLTKSKLTGDTHGEPWFIDSEAMIEGSKISLAGEQ